MPTDIFLFFKELNTYQIVAGTLASNKLLPDFMDTTIIWESLAGTLIFAAANILFFEIRRLLRTYLNKFKSLQDPQEFENNPQLDKGSSEI
jgi:hypothetical protein